MKKKKIQILYERTRKTRIKLLNLIKYLVKNIAYKNLINLMEY